MMNKRTIKIKPAQSAPLSDAKKLTQDELKEKFIEETIAEVNSETARKRMEKRMRKNLGLEKLGKKPDPVDESFKKEYKKLNELPSYWGVTAVIRNLLSLGMIVMIMRETGPWTSFFAFFMFIGIEATTHHIKLLSYGLKTAIRVNPNERQRILDELDRIEKQGKDGA